MKKSLYSVPIILFVFSVLGTFAVSPTVVDAATPIACPYSSSGNTYVVSFPTAGPIMSNHSPRETAPVSINIPAGNYDVTMVAWDDHSGHGGQGQNYEQYYLNLYGTSGYFQNIGRSLDIPENQDSQINIAEGSDSIASGLPFITIRQNVTSVVASHLFPGTGGYQSVYPICVKFVKRNTPTPDPDLAVSCTVSDPSIYKTESTTFTANATGGSGTYTYTWLDGVSGTSRVETETFNNSGTYNARVRVQSAGQTVTANCPVLVVENPPIIALEGSCSVSDSSVDINESVTFTAHATGNAPYTYTWLNIVSGTGQTKSRVFANEGSYTARVRIDDRAGESLTVSCPVVVVDNDAPQTDLTGSCSVSDSSVDINESVTFTAHATGNAPYTYTWLNIVSGTGQTKSRVFANEGSYTARVRIDDRAGESLTVSCPVVVVDNDAPPQADISVSCQVSDTRVEEGDVVSFTATVSGGNSPFIYDWRGDVDGTDRTESVRLNREGNYNASVRVEDEDGNVATDDCSTVVVDEEDNDDNDNDNDNDEDLEIQCRVSETRVEVGDSVTFSADVDGGESPYEYDWRGDVRGDERRETVRFNSPGRYTASVSVEDDENNRESDSCSTVIVENRGNNVLGATTVFNTPSGTGQVASVNSVFLGQIPITGSEDAVKIFLYVFGLLVWSIVVVYFILRNRNRKNVSGKVEEFKMKNMKQRGLI